MNKLIFFFILIQMTTFGQTNWQQGFNKGFKKGYCYNSPSCVSPPPPPSVPIAGSSYDSYEDGYTQGVAEGQKAYLKKEDNKNPKGYVGTSATFLDNSNSNIDYLNIIQAMNNSLEINQAKEDKNKEIQRKKAIGMMELIKDYYKSLQSLPEKIPDGWYKVISMDNYETCAERKVYVSNNQVKKYIVNDWSDRNILFSSSIVKGKSLVQVYKDDKSKAVMVEVYFLDFINNPNSITSPPLAPGKISFWTDLKRGGIIKVYLKGVGSGEIKSYFNELSPNCEQSGVLTFKCKPGKYNYTATSEGFWGTSTWEGSVNIYEGGCSMEKLTK